MLSEKIENKRTHLQQLIGDSPTIHIGTFENWGKTQKRSKILSCSPKSLAEIKAVVKACHQLGIRVRAAGAKHSWSPLFSDEGQLVMYTADLKRDDGPQIQLIQNPGDPCDKHVNVMCNVTVDEMMQFELAYGVCLPANVVLRNVTYGGLVTTACHGVGKDCLTISDYVTAMTIVNSEGNLITYSVEKDGEEMMKAVRVNLGLFGIIYDITLKVQSMMFVETKNIFCTVKDAFYDKEYIRYLFENNWSVEIFWFPYNSMDLGDLTKALFSKVDWSLWNPKEDRVWIRLVNKVKKVGQIQPEEVYTFDGIRQKIEGTLGLVFESFLTRHPSLTPHFTNAVEHSMRKQFRDKTVTQQLPYAIHYRDYVDECPMRDMEWAIDADYYCEATQHVVEKVEKEAREGRFPLTMVMELRLMGYSNTYLASSRAGNPDQGGSGNTLHVEILSLVGTQGWKDFADNVAERWMELPGARPHWAKEWSDIKGVKQHLQKIYGEDFARFQEQLQLADADPDGIFLNNCLQKLLYPNGHEGWKKLFR